MAKLSIRRVKAAAPTASAGKDVLEQFVIMPTSGFHLEKETAPPGLLAMMSGLAVSAKAAVVEVAPKRTVKMKVLDSINDGGPKLVQMTREDMAVAKVHAAHFRIVPVVWFGHAAFQHRVTSLAAAAHATAKQLSIRIVSSKDGTGVAGARVVAFTNFALKEGADGTSDKKGGVTLPFGPGQKFERVYVYPQMGFWGALLTDVTLKAGQEIPLQAVDLTMTDSLRHFYGTAAPDAGKGVRVGVVDSGVDVQHPDLKVSGGMNTVLGEKPGDFGDNGTEGHGTHVAGIIAARGTPPQGCRGVAPGVELYSYRVFGKGADRASNYSIAKAVRQGAKDRCDLLNMSLGGGNPDEPTKEAIRFARDQGTLVIVAAGNDYRSPISFPAVAEFSVPISALGRKGTFPDGTPEADEVAPPFGTDPKDFIANFSNIGPEMELTGSGVGVLSTVPGGYAPMSGTSMACPAVTGVAARLLSKAANVLGMPRDAARSDAIENLLLAAAKDMGFPKNYQGNGMPQQV